MGSELLKLNARKVRQTSVALLSQHEKHSPPIRCVGSPSNKARGLKSVDELRSAMRLHQQLLGKFANAHAAGGGAHPDSQ